MFRHPFRSKSTLVATVVLASGLLSVMPTHLAHATEAEQAVPNKVTKADARKAAIWEVYDQAKNEPNSKWAHNGFKLSNAQEVYDPSGQLVSYLFNVKMNKQPSGYIMVSAFEDEEPIMAYTETGEGFNTDTAQIHLGDKANKVKSKKLVWLGGVSFAGQYEMTDGTQTLANENGLLQNAEKVKKQKYPAPGKTNESARKIWKEMQQIGVGDIGTDSDGITDEDPSNWEVNYTSIHRNYIDTPVNQKQWYYSGKQATGCSPTAGSNIMKYWADKGYTGLNPTGFQALIVMDLRKEMGTTQLADGTGDTSYYNIDDGLQSYARKNGRPNAVATNHDFANFSTVVTEIDAQRPALQSYWDQTYLGDHTVTLVGYKEYVRPFGTSNSYYVVIRNNFIGETYDNIYVRWGSWNSNVVTTFTP